MVLILYGNSVQVEHAYRKKYFRIKKMRFVTDLDLIKGLKQIKGQRLILSCATISELPSDISIAVCTGKTGSFLSFHEYFISDLFLAYWGQNLNMVVCLFQFCYIYFLHLFSHSLTLKLLFEKLAKQISKAEESFKKNEFDSKHPFIARNWHFRGYKMIF